MQEERGAKRPNSSNRTERTLAEDEEEVTVKKPKLMEPLSSSSQNPQTEELKVASLSSVCAVWAQKIGLTAIRVQIEYLGSTFHPSSSVNRTFCANNVNFCVNIVKLVELYL